jgi:hypothetical protein
MEWKADQFRNTLTAIPFLLFYITEYYLKT